MKGSMTVEASFVLPLGFLFLGIVFYLGIYQYNQAVLQMTGYECILMNVDQLAESEYQFQESLIQQAETSAKARTLGIEEMETTVKVTPTRVFLSYRCRQRMILETDLEVVVSYERIYPELTFRLGGI